MIIKKVRALENHYDGLTKDQVYDVVKLSEDSDFYWVDSDFGAKSFYCWRFEEVVDDNFVKEKPSTTNIAELLVNKLFELGDEGNKKTNRIAFMIGEYGVDEESSGGMNKQALVKFFERILKENK